MALNWRVEVTKSHLRRECYPARVSVPLPRGAGTPEGFSVARPDGAVVPAQARTLVPWPDGSPRWVQIDFQTNASGTHVVRGEPARGEPVLPVRIEGGTICVGRLQVELAPDGRSPVGSIHWDGRALTEGSESWRFTAVRDDGRAFPLAGRRTRDPVVEAGGPHRYQVSWETEHQDEVGDRLLDVRFRVEFLAGIEGFSLSYQFFHKLPGHDTLRLKSVECAFGLEGMGAVDGRTAIVQTAYSELWLRRFVRTKDEVRILLDRTRFDPHVENADVLGDESVYPYFLRGGHDAVSSAVGLEDQGAAALCVMRDFKQQRPKALTVRPGEIRFGIWPERAGMLELPQGRSSRQVFDFLFLPPDAEKVNSLLASPRSCYVEPAVGWLNKSDSVHAGATWDQPRLMDEHDSGAAFFSYFLHSGAGRWRTVAEMFHYGDTVDIGYTVNYVSGGRVPTAGNAPGEHTFAADGGPHIHFQTPHGLAPVWSNNEYDAIYCLALEALRTRDGGIREKLQAAARHQIEVDFVHYSDHWMHHRSTPAHSYDHVTGAASIASHQWTQGLYYYYALTGDDDVPEVVRAICDFDAKYVEREGIGETLQFDRELGWAVVALVFGYELTADENYVQAAGNILSRLVGLADRADFEEYERLHPTSRGLNIAGLGGGFNVNTVPLGAKCYHQATQDEWARRLLLGWVEYGMKNHNDRSTGVKITELFPESFCYACELTGQTRYLEDSLWQLAMFFRGFNSIGWLQESEPLTTKQFARVYRGLSHYLSALARAGLLEKAERLILGTGPDGADER